MNLLLGTDHWLINPTSRPGLRRAGRHRLGARRLVRRTSAVTAACSSPAWVDTASAREAHSRRQGLNDRKRVRRETGKEPSPPDPSLVGGERPGSAGDGRLFLPPSAQRHESGRARPRTAGPLTRLLPRSIRRCARLNRIAHGLPPWAWRLRRLRDRADGPPASPTPSTTEFSCARGQVTGQRPYVICSQGDHPCSAARR